MANRPMFDDDAVRKRIDRILRRNEREIKEIYIAAGIVLKKLLNAYLKQYAEQDYKRRKQWQDGKITEQDYLQWRVATILMTKKWIATRGKITNELVDAATKARFTTLSYMPTVFRVARNESLVQIANDATRLIGATPQIMHDKIIVKGGISFNLVDEHTANRLFTTKDRIYHMMGKKKFAEVQRGERIPWEKNKVQSALLTSILTGEDIGQIAERLAATVPVDDMNEAIRDARTMTTGAESAGRVDSYVEAEQKGIIMKQEWISTVGDGRTREAHLKLNHQQTDVGEPFKVNGDTIRFPGDPTAPGYLVYNCRCTIAAIVLGFR